MIFPKKSYVGSGELNPRKLLWRSRWIDWAFR